MLGTRSKKDGGEKGGARGRGAVSGQCDRHLYQAVVMMVVVVWGGGDLHEASGFMVTGVPPRCFICSLYLPAVLSFSLCSHFFFFFFSPPCGDECKLTKPQSCHHNHCPPGTAAAPPAGPRLPWLLNDEA
ncbi:unnamed protein product [Pleuronectes platessa]|uniref:Uncharacterized protein n=1 Tax=Pleuronectes platessa TaxID=8262 RepID=A0A9N7U993_PLEPL|nr:unnamed protein product [Pleuronectes platessa]